MCGCDTSVLKCVHLKINNSRNVSGSWGISGCLKLPRVCSCLRGWRCPPGVVQAGPGRAAWGLSSSSGGVGVTPLDCCWWAWWPAQSQQVLWARQTLGAEAVSVGCFTSLSGEASGTLLSRRGWALGRTWHRPSVSARACGRDGRAWRRAGTQRPRPAAGPCEGRCGGRPLREARRGGGPGRGAIPARARVSVGVLVRGGRGLGPRAPLATVGMSREVLASRVLRTGRGAQKRGSVPHVASAPRGRPGTGMGLV